MTDSARGASRQHFEQLYVGHPDPWQFETSRYEQEKYRATLSYLSRDFYGSVFEPGCSIGVLTELLAPHCSSLTAVDLSPTAVTRARQRCERFKHVQITSGEFQRDLLPDRFDLVVFSEIGYYFSMAGLRDIVRSLSTSLRPGGELVAVHWLGDSVDHCLSGDEVHETLAAHLGINWECGDRCPGYRIDRWRAS